jgi:protein-tyrosine kinase
MQATRAETRLDLQAIEPIATPARPGGPLVWSHEHSSAAERFRLLAHRLNRARAKKPIQVVLITSAIPAEGKSTIALNLAGVLTRNGARTLLIDADMRRPDAHKILGFGSMPGLSNVLNGEIELETAMRRLDPLGLYFVPAGDRVSNPVPLLEGTALAAVLQRTRPVFEWIVIDSPPINPLADAQCIGSIADTIMLVVRWGFTPKEELDHALLTLEGLPFLGMVINRFDGPQDSYYYSYYSRPDDDAPAALPAPTPPDA